jgi:acyl-CoA reductase-like NAD-dependent aldehyde dehydrogenase
MLTWATQWMLLYLGPSSIKGSGIGREGGMYSAQQLTELKWITIQQTKKSFSI